MSKDLFGRNATEQILAAWGVTDEEKLQAMKLIHCKKVSPDEVLREIKNISNARAQIKAWESDLACQECVDNKY